MEPRLHNPPPNRHACPGELLRFPAEASRAQSDAWRFMTGRRLEGDRGLLALARHLNCLGHFAEPPGPRAA
jgi:hypothetical protein